MPEHGEPFGEEGVLAVDVGVRQCGGAVAVGVGFLTNSLGGLMPTILRAMVDYQSEEDRVYIGLHRYHRTAPRKHCGERVPTSAATAP